MWRVDPARAYVPSESTSVLLAARPFYVFEPAIALAVFLGFVWLMGPNEVERVLFVIGVLGLSFAIFARTRFLSGIAVERDALVFIYRSRLGAGSTARVSYTDIERVDLGNEYTRAGRVAVRTRGGDVHSVALFGKRQPLFATRINRTETAFPDGPLAAVSHARAFCAVLSACGVKVVEEPVPSFRLVGRNTPPN